VAVPFTLSREGQPRVFAPLSFKFFPASFRGWKSHHPKHSEGSLSGTEEAVGEREEV